MEESALWMRWHRTVAAIGNQLASDRCTATPRPLPQVAPEPRRSDTYMITSRSRLSPAHRCNRVAFTLMMHWLCFLWCLCEITHAFNERFLVSCLLFLFGC